jgi:hypothetical protein
MMKFAFGMAVITVCSLAQADVVKFKCDPYERNGEPLLGVSTPQIVQKDDGNLYVMTQVIAPNTKPIYDLLTKENGSDTIRALSTLSIYALFTD